MQLSPLSNLQAYASASATASSSPQRVSLSQLLHNACLVSDGQVLDALEIRRQNHHCKPLSTATHLALLPSSGTFSGVFNSSNGYLLKSTELKFIKT